MPNLIAIDVSELEPPEPLTRILAAAQALTLGDLLQVRHRREPHPLYPMLEQLELRYRLHSHADDSVTLLIWRADDHRVTVFCEEQFADAD